jgi:hypothetical protein
MSHWKKAILDRLDKLHELYGHEQSIPDILDGIITRVERARQLYGNERSLPDVVNGIYYQLGELLQLYGTDSIEEILAGYIDRKKRLNRLVELKSKGTLTFDEHHEIEYLERLRQRRVDDLAKQKAQERKTRANNGKAPSAANGKSHGANGKTSNAIF